MYWHVWLIKGGGGTDFVWWTTNLFAPGESPSKSQGFRWIYLICFPLMCDANIIYIMLENQLMLCRLDSTLDLPWEDDTQYPFTTQLHDAPTIFWSCSVLTPVLDSWTQGFESQLCYHLIWNSLAGLLGYCLLQRKWAWLIGVSGLCLRILVALGARRSTGNGVWLSQMCKNKKHISESNGSHWGQSIKLERITQSDEGESERYY